MPAQRNQYIESAYERLQVISQGYNTVFINLKYKNITIKTGEDTAKYLFSSTEKADSCSIPDRKKVFPGAYVQDRVYNSAYSVLHICTLVF